LSPGRIRKLEENNKDFAESLEKWHEKKQEYEIILRLLIFFTAGVITVYSFVMYMKIFQTPYPYLIALLSSASTFFLLMVMEIVTGTLVYLFDLGVLRVTMPIVEVLRKSLFMPIVGTMMFIKRRIDMIQSLTNGVSAKKASAEDEILSLVDKEKKSPTDIEESEKKMIKGVFDLNDTTAREIMTSRVQISGLSSDSSLIEAKNKIISTGHSRIPVYEHSTDNIKGILYAKDLLDDAKIAGKTILEISRKPLFIPENKTLAEVLEEFKRRSGQFAVIVDEYGGTAGILTFEDIVEQIVGEIGDEYDTQEDVLPDKTELPDGSVVFDGKALASEANSIFDNEIGEEDGIDTIGGLVCSKLGRIPETGEKFVLNNSIQITILKADRRKIIKLKASRKK